MAENMRAIKKRIKGVNSTKQITHAMELVASSKLRKAREKAEARRMYFEEMIYAVRELAILQTEKPTNPFFIEGKGDRTLVVVITANKGLAGGYNNNIIKLALSYCKDVNNTDFIVAGNNGIEYFRYRKYNVIEELRTNSEDPSYNEAKQIEERVISLFKSGNYREINIAYTKFVSTISQKPLGIKLLPLDKDDLCQNSDID
ncbi:MAG: F0F1 ATP synthase subunit gamma, partial [Clostridiales bacterium]|nr:F0F1 ATP synthase subunit gamma [Clostridiales bacterium]